LREIRSALVLISRKGAKAQRMKNASYDGRQYIPYHSLAQTDFLNGMESCFMEFLLKELHKKYIRKGFNDD